MRAIGIFPMAQVWMLHAADEAPSAYCSRADAITAALWQIEAERRLGRDCEVWVQDTTGFVARLEPADLVTEAAFG